MEDYIQVLISIDTQDGARQIQRLLLAERAAACVQVLGPVSSSYWWQGKIDEAQEWLCLAKTTRAVYHRLEGLVKKHHPYDTPEIIGIPILLGNRPYLDWVGAETRA